MELHVAWRSKTHLCVHANICSNVYDYEVKRVVGHDRLDSYTVIYYVLWMNTNYEDALDQVLDLDCRCPILIEEYWHRRETHGGGRVDKDGWDHNTSKYIMVF